MLEARDGGPERTVANMLDATAESSELTAHVRSEVVEAARELVQALAGTTPEAKARIVGVIAASILSAESGPVLPILEVLSEAEKVPHSPALSQSSKDGGSDSREIIRRRPYLGRLVEWDDPAFVRVYLAAGEFEGRALRRADDYEGIGTQNFEKNTDFRPEGLTPVKGQTMVAWCRSYQTFGETASQTEIIQGLLKLAFFEEVDPTRQSSESRKLSYPDVIDAVRSAELGGKSLLEVPDLLFRSVPELLGAITRVGGEELTLGTVLKRAAGFTEDRSGLELAISLASGEPTQITGGHQIHLLPPEMLREMISTATLDGQRCNTLENILEAGLRRFVHEVHLEFRGKQFKGAALMDDHNLWKFRRMLIKVFGEEAMPTIERYEARVPSQLLKLPALLRRFMENGVFTPAGGQAVRISTPHDYLGIGVGKFCQPTRGSAHVQLDGYEPVRVAGLIQACGGQNSASLKKLVQLAFGPEQFWQSA